ncbi:hypothetical protein ACFV97_23910 [Streptomyces sp. NPDC059913]|uniref:hypothetical protein n=1 Tax=unclassified Streptomyces TaxID=2593676 RepID=UPI0036565580
MIAAAPLPPAHRRVRGSGVLLALVWIAFHLLGCVHSHASELGAHHVPMEVRVTAPAAPAPPGTGPVTASSSDSGSCCPESDHAADWLRTDTPSAPVPGGALTAQVRPCPAAAALMGCGADRASVRRPAGGRCVLTALCVART